jgi:hypothetical protein
MNAQTRISLKETHLGRHERFPSLLCTINEEIHRIRHKVFPFASNAYALSGTTSLQVEGHFHFLASKL